MVGPRLKEDLLQTPLKTVHKPLFELLSPFRYLLILWPGPAGNNISILLLVRKKGTPFTLAAVYAFVYVYVWAYDEGTTACRHRLIEGDARQRERVSCSDGKS